MTDKYIIDRHHRVIVSGIQRLKALKPQDSSPKAYQNDRLFMLTGQQ